MLPKNELGEDILEGIKTLMPGIKIRDWNYDSTSKRKVRRSNHQPALIKYFETMDIGRIAILPISIVSKYLIRAG